MTLDPVHHRILEHHAQWTADQMTQPYLEEELTMSAGASHDGGSGPVGVRTQLGHALVRLGRWVEGRCPETLPEPTAPRP